MLVKLTVLRLQLIGGRRERKVCRSDHVGVRRPIGVQVLPEGVQSYREAVGQVDQKRRAQAAAIAMIDVFFSERGIVDVARQRLVVTAQAKCGAVTDREVDHALPDSAALSVRDILTPNLGCRGKLRRVGWIGHVLEETALTAGSIQGALGPAQCLDTLQVPGVEITGETKAVDERVARAEGRIVDVGGDRRADPADVLAAEGDPCVARFDAGQR